MTGVINGGDPTSCVYDSVPGANPGSTGSENTTFTAPTISGTYTVIARAKTSDNCSIALYYYNIGTTIQPTIGTIMVP